MSMSYYKAKPPFRSSAARMNIPKTLVALVHQAHKTYTSYNKDVLALCHCRINRDKTEGACVRYIMNSIGQFAFTVRSNENLSITADVKTISGGWISVCLQINTSILHSSDTTTLALMLVLSEISAVITVLI